LHYLRERREKKPAAFLIGFASAPRALAGSIVAAAYGIISESRRGQ